LEFSFHSDIINLFKKENLNAVSRVIEIGQLMPEESIIIPICAFTSNLSGSFDLFTITNKVLIPKSIEFQSLDNLQHKQSIREILEYPFSISVNIDERG
jgi:hypothetical protein